VVSCDSLGVVKLWDVRKIAVIESHDFGPYAANSITISPLSTVVVAASDDGSLKSYNIQSQQVAHIFISLTFFKLNAYSCLIFFLFEQLTPLTGHEDAVSCVKFDLNGSYLLSGGCDNTLRVWS
jgi:WD40 repeat protein